MCNPGINKRKNSALHSVMDIARRIWKKICGKNWELCSENMWSRCRECVGAGVQSSFCT
jgi:hypothetical protein